MPTRYPPRFRTLVLADHDQGMSNGDIQRKYGVSKTTIATWIFDRHQKEESSPREESSLATKLPGTDIVEVHVYLSHDTLLMESLERIAIALQRMANAWEIEDE